MILGVIPARGGSKGLKRKNLMEICGKPLIAWSIESAIESELLDNFVVSTEDKEIKEVADFYGAQVLDRPHHLALDESTTISVLKHVVEELNPNIVVVLQPTSPLRNDDTIDKCLESFLSSGADNLVTGYYCKYREFGTYDNLRRQDYKGFFNDDGNVYILKKELILTGRWSGDNIIRYVTEREENYEIDDNTDFYVVEKLLEKRLLDKLTPKVENIKLLAMDVDGVLTDGSMYYTEKGDEIKKFNTRDGKGIELIRNQGIKTAIITQEETEITKVRARKLKIDHLYQNVHDKAAAVVKIAKEENININQIAYIGDDFNDLALLKTVGFSATPADGIIENKRFVNYICRKKGGEGCVREFCEWIIKGNKQSKFENLSDK